MDDDQLKEVRKSTIGRHRGENLSQNGSLERIHRTRRKER
jgi:hypothetical protein